MTDSRLAFIFHPLNLKTLALMLGFDERFLKKIPRQYIHNFLKAKRPFVLDEIRGLTSQKNSKIDLVCIVCPLLPEQFITENECFVLKKIQQATDLATKRNCDLAVLAGFTSIVGNQGEALSKVAKIPITTGNTFTAYLTIESILTAADKLDLDLKKAKCAIIGAAGDIGSYCLKALTKLVPAISVAIRRTENFSSIYNEFSVEDQKKIKICKTTKECLEDADIIITATSSLTTLIEASWLKRGAILCDVALPPNVAREISSLRSDVLVIEGGLCKIPNFNLIKKSKLGIWWSRNAIYGCLGEGLCFAFDRRYESFSVGRGKITSDKVLDVAGLAKKHGIGCSDFFSGNKEYNHTSIAFIKQQKMTQRSCSPEMLYEHNTI